MKPNTQYGVFIYANDNDGEPPIRCDYFIDKRSAIKKATSHLIELAQWLRVNYPEKPSFYDWWMIEVWKRDKDGLYGNCGLPVWCTRNSGFFEDVVTNPHRLDYIQKLIAP